MDDATLTQRVRELAADAISIDPSRLDDNANLFEAGAQSLEFLDIVFKLEQEYGIEITRGEMEQAAQTGMSEEDFAPHGVVSEAGLQRLRELMPEAQAKIVPGLRTSQILSLFTLQTFVRIVQRKIATA